jgi:hypothetical protein
LQPGVDGDFSALAVFFGGENDLRGGNSSQDLADSFDAFIADGVE